MIFIDLGTYVDENNARLFCEKYVYVYNLVIWKLLESIALVGSTDHTAQVYQQRDYTFGCKRKNPIR